MTSQSLEKIEDGIIYPLHFRDVLSVTSNFIAAYAIFVRSSEYDLSPEMLDDIVAQSISGYNASSHDTSIGQPRGRRDYGSDDDSNHHDV